MEKTRKTEISFANIFCALAVVFIHINSEAVEVLDKSGFAYGAAHILWQAALFVVYGFIFLSGIKQLWLNPKNFRR